MLLSAVPHEYPHPHILTYPYPVPLNWSASVWSLTLLHPSPSMLVPSWKSLETRSNPSQNLSSAWIGKAKLDTRNIQHTWTKMWLWTKTQTQLSSLKRRAWMIKSFLSWLHKRYGSSHFEEVFSFVSATCYCTSSRGEFPFHHPWWHCNGKLSPVPTVLFWPYLTMAQETTVMHTQPIFHTNAIQMLGLRRTPSCSSNELQPVLCDFARTPGKCWTHRKKTYDKILEHVMNISYV